MDQVERALLVVSGDAASSKLVADSQVNPYTATPSMLMDLAMITS